MMLRRTLMTGIACMALANCSTITQSVTLETAKPYLIDLIGAISAAAQAYVSGPLPLPFSPLNRGTVELLTSDLQMLLQAINGAVSATDVKSLALQVLAVVNQLVPFVGPFLGPAGPVIPIAVAVITAFVQALPAPPDAPPTPPAALHAKAMTYRPQQHQESP